MITREIYLQYARKNQVPMVLLYQYYQKFNTRPNLSLSLDEFEEYFTVFITNFAVTLEHVRAYYDSFYGITTVYDKEGNFVTIF